MLLLSGHCQTPLLSNHCYLGTMGLRHAHQVLHTPHPVVALCLLLELVEPSHQAVWASLVSSFKLLPDCVSDKKLTLKTSKRLLQMLL